MSAQFSESESLAIPLLNTNLTIKVCHVGHLKFHVICTKFNKTEMKLFFSHSLI